MALQSDEYQKLRESIGKVALADAELDEWLIQMLTALLHPMPRETVVLLVGMHSALKRMELIAKLAESHAFPSIDVETFSSVIRELRARHRSAIDKRNTIMHGFHAVVDGELKRYRSRTQASEIASLEEVDAVAADLSQIALELRTAIRLVETATAAASSYERILDEHREVLSVAHLKERNLLQPILDALDRDAIIRVSTDDYGRRRILSPHDEPTPDATVGQIHTAGGRIDVTLPSGEQIIGGDTGWRDITELARAADPSIEFARVRRIDQSVLLVEKRDGSTAPIGDAFPDLSARLFAEKSDLIPDYLKPYEAFMPSRRG